MIDIFQVLIDTFDLPDVCFKIQSSPFFRKSIYTGTIKGSILKASLTLMPGQCKKIREQLFPKTLNGHFCVGEDCCSRCVVFGPQKIMEYFQTLKLMTFICQRIFLKRVYKICQIASNLVLKLM